MKPAGTGSATGNTATLAAGQPLATNPFSLHGKTALVTGAGRGLGRAVATALGLAGAEVIALDLSPLNDFKDELEAQGVKCRIRSQNLANLSQDQAAEIITWAKETGRGPDILVNNAGLIRRGPALTTTLEDWESVIGLNLTTPFVLSQAFTRSLIDEDRPGSIINILSINAFQGGVEVPSYAASKHGLLGVTRALANEWAPHGIRVNGIAPGYMETELTAAHREDPARYQAMRSRMPIGRWGQPDEIGGAAVYLASAASTYLSGTVINVDGGWLSR